MTYVDLYEQIKARAKPIQYADELVTFFIDMTSMTPHVMSFVVYEVGSWDEKNEPIDVEMYLEGDIKWDGCSNVQFQEGYIHLCGVTNWKRHAEMMLAVIDYASKNIEKWDAEVAR